MPLVLQTQVPDDDPVLSVPLENLDDLSLRRYRQKPCKLSIFHQLIRISTTYAKRFKTNSSPRYDSPLLTHHSRLLKSLASVKANPVKDKLSKELEIVMAAIPLTHILAVLGKQLTSKSHQPRRVTL